MSAVEPWAGAPPPAGGPRLPPVRGRELLEDPLRNKGTAFTEAERTAFGLHGLLPPQVETLEEQVVRAWEAYERKSDDLERYIYLRALQDTNEVLFYRLLLDHMEATVPVVYTPVVALGCEEFSHVYRRPRGLFLPYPLRDEIPELLRHRPHPEVDVIVVTDGERILGIGDQGVGGLGIPIGKLALYTLLGGIPPDRTLPIVLDAGTNNPERLADPEYLGWRHPRVTGAEYDAFVDQFVEAVRAELPRTLVQWEDFGQTHARPILERYRRSLLSFNDDILGTGAVVLGTLLSALDVLHRPLAGERIVFLGAGTAAVGVADTIADELRANGASETTIHERFWFVNRGGALHDGRRDLSPEQGRYARRWDDVALPGTPRGARIGLAEVVERVRPTALIGLSTSGGAFTEPIVRSMARATPRPIVLALSNPTSRSEATPSDVARWTDGRAIVATGSPFPPLRDAGGERPVPQCNNSYVFPGLGLGVVVARASRVNSPMVLAAAHALASLAPARADPNAPILPPLGELRRVAAEIALRVGLAAQATGVAPPSSIEELRARFAAAQWVPEYPRYLGD